MHESSLKERVAAAPGAPVLQACVDHRCFRDALGRFATGVTIVTTRDEQGRLYGVTASSFNSVSIDPPMVLWSQATRAPSNAVFQRTPHFCVNVLSAEQCALSDSFARPAPDKFAGVDYSLTEEGLPLLHGSLAHFICRNDYKCYGGDHTIFVATVLRFGHPELADPKKLADPLIFFGGRYRD